MKFNLNQKGKMDAFIPEMLKRVLLSIFWGIITLFSPDAGLEEMNGNG